MCSKRPKNIQADKKLWESEARYRTLFDNAQDGMALADTETGRLVDCNFALCRMVKRNKAELIGQAQSILHPPPETNTDKLTRTTFQQHKIGDPGKVLEDLFLSKSGKLVPVEIRAARIHMNDRDYLLGIFRDITERKQAEKKIRIHRKKLQTLHNQLLETEEQERRRLAIELHDNFGQKLALLKIKLGTIRQLKSSQDILEQLEEHKKVFEEIIKDIRSLTFQLSPPLLNQLGLNATVEWLTEKINKEHGLEFKLKTPEKEYPLDLKLRFLIYRCIQELLTNVIKHSQAHKVGLSIRQDGDLMKIRIEDDGVGFDIHILSFPGNKESFGLFSVKERLSNLGGLLKVNSAPGRGTRVTLVVPLR